MKTKLSLLLVTAFYSGYSQKEKEFLIPSTETAYYVEGEKPATDFHRTHTGQIVFSKSKIDAGVNSGATLSTTFSFGDNIDARFFLETSICNYYVYANGSDSKDPNSENFKCYYVVYAYIDGVRMPAALTNDYMEREDRPMTTFRQTIYGTGENSKYNDQNFVEALNKLNAGEHTIRLELYAGRHTIKTSIKPVAAGEFKLIKKEGTVLKRGIRFSDSAPKMKNPALEKQALKEINEAAALEGIKESYSKISILDANWIITKNKHTGVILSRYLNVLGYCKKENGSCVMRGFIIRQAYEGGGIYQSTLTVDDAKTGATDIDCE